MTLGNREYTEADMLRMQREAEERVLDMQNRARATVEQDNMNIPPVPPRNRNWSSGPGSRRQNRRYPPRPQESQQQRQQEPPPPPEPPEEAPPPPTAPEEKKQTTMIEDVMGALNLDEDYLLIVGMLLILINQRADTTLILALAYLLI